MSNLSDEEITELLAKVDSDCMCIHCGEVVDEEADHAADCPLLRLVNEVRERRG